MIGIVDYGVGNLRAVQNMFARVGVPADILNDSAAIRNASKLILPGVGAFGYAMDCLQARGLVDVLSERVMKAGVPILGICLGAQLIGRRSDEGNASGLNWLPMDTVAFDRSRMVRGEKVPHIGWAHTNHTDHPLFFGLGEHARFYYVHSFHFRVDDPAVIISTATHGYMFPTGFASNNILGVQFHPEKSHAFGWQLLKNFADTRFY